MELWYITHLLMNKVTNFCDRHQDIGFWRVLFALSVLTSLMSSDSSGESQVSWAGPCWLLRVFLTRQGKLQPKHKDQGDQTATQIDAQAKKYTCLQYFQLIYQCFWVKSPHVSIAASETQHARAKWSLVAVRQKNYFGLIWTCLARERK